MFLRISFRYSNYRRHGTNSRFLENNELLDQRAHMFNGKIVVMIVTSLYTCSLFSMHDLPELHIHSRTNGKKPSTQPFKVVQTLSARQQVQSSESNIPIITPVRKIPIPSHKEPLTVIVYNDSLWPITLQAEYRQPRPQIGMPPLSPYIYRTAKELSTSTIILAQYLKNKPNRRLIGIHFIHEEACPLSLGEHECAQSPTFAIELSSDCIYNPL